MQRQADPPYLIGASPGEVARTLNRAAGLEEAARAASRLSTTQREAQRDAERKAAEEKRRAEQARVAEQKRKAEAERKRAEEARIAEQKRVEAQRQAEFQAELDQPLYDCTDRFVVKQGAQPVAHVYTMSRMMDFESLRIPVGVVAPFLYLDTKPKVALP